MDLFPKFNCNYFYQNFISVIILSFWHHTVGLLCERDGQVSKFFFFLWNQLDLIFFSTPIALWCISLWSVILVVIYRVLTPGYFCVLCVAIVIHNMKAIFGVVKLWYDVSICCGDVQLPLILHGNKSVVHCLHLATPSSSITIFDDRYIQRIQVSLDRMSGNSRSSFVNEIKGSCSHHRWTCSVVWGGSTEKGEAAPLAVVTPSLPLHLPSLSHSLSLSSLFHLPSCSLCFCVSLSLTPTFPCLGTGAVGELAAMSSVGESPLWVKQ